MPAPPPFAAGSAFTGAGGGVLGGIGFRFLLGSPSHPKAPAKTSAAITLQNIFFTDESPCGISSRKKQAAPGGKPPGAPRPRSSVAEHRGVDHVAFAAP